MTNHVPIPAEIRTTSLHEAVIRHDYSDAEYFLKIGSNVNEENLRGMTPLGLAVSHGEKNMIELLLAHGAELEVRDRYGDVPFLRSLDGYGHTNEKLEIAKLLLSRGARLNSQNTKRGYNLLHRAIEYNHTDAVEYLLSLNIDINTMDRERPTIPTPLFLAVSYYCDFEKLEQGRWKGHTSRTKDDDKKMIQLLIANGADSEAKNADGLSVIQYTEAEGCPEVRHFLRIICSLK